MTVLTQCARNRGNTKRLSGDSLAVDRVAAFAHDLGRIPGIIRAVIIIVDRIRGRRQPDSCKAISYRVHLRPNPRTVDSTAIRIRMTGRAHRGILVRSSQDRYPSPR